MRTREAMTISLPPAMVKEVVAFAKKESKNKSQLIRDALNQYMLEKRWRNYQREISAQGRARGIYTEEDVNRVIHEYRKEKGK